jgi:hypothetical protein
VSEEDDRQVLDYGRPQPRRVHYGAATAGAFASAVVLYATLLFTIVTNLNLGNTPRPFVWWPPVFGLGIFGLLLYTGWSWRRRGLAGFWIGLWIGVGLLLQFLGICAVGMR